MAVKAKQNTSLVRNTASRLTLNKGKTTRRRKSSHRRNTTTLKANRASQVRSRRRYRRNSAASATAGLFAAFSGALIINLFDALVNRVAPQTSGTHRMIGKFGAGFLIGAYGNKLPLVRGFAPIISNSLYIAGALDLVGTYIMPHVLGFISPAAPVVVASTPVKLATGEMGMAHTLSDGNVVEVYDDQMPQGNYGYNNRFAYP
jgi:hypothetical protein